MFDRYGEPTGEFLAWEGTPYENRSLASYGETANYYRYKVTKPFKVIEGDITPWFDQPGGGIQLHGIDKLGSKIKVEQLIKDRYLIHLK